MKGFFVGYADGVKGYRIWCEQHGKCIISRNVIFNEAAMVKARKEIIEADMHVEEDVN